jgi:hypothetical protein
MRFSSLRGCTTVSSCCEMPLALDMFERKLLSGAHAFFITPECNIVEITVRLVTNTCQTEQRTIFIKSENSLSLLLPG